MTEDRHEEWMEGRLLAGQEEGKGGEKDRGGVKENEGYCHSAGHTWFPLSPDADTLMVHLDWLCS